MGVTIKEGEFIGAFFIGMAFTELIQYLKVNKLRYTITNSDFISRIVLNEFILVIEAKSCKLSQVSLIKNNGLKFREIIGIGSRIEDLSKIGHYKYIEEDEVYMLDGIDGICFEADSIDDFDESEIIYGISIFSTKV